MFFFFASAEGIHGGLWTNWQQYLQEKNPTNNAVKSKWLTANAILL